MGKGEKNMITNATRDQLEAALTEVNAKYGGNIRWNREPEQTGRRLAFTLRTVSSKGPGHSRGTNFLGFDKGFEKGKRLPSACWHVHGYLFDALLKNDGVYIISRGKRIDKDGGNWEDFNAGSQMFPFMMSDRCDCEEGL
jgi:hypothetical protein